MTTRDRARAVKAWAASLIEDIDDTHPEAISRFDALDGVGATLTGVPHPKKHAKEGDDAHHR